MASNVEIHPVGNGFLKRIKGMESIVLSSRGDKLQLMMLLVDGHYSEIHGKMQKQSISPSMSRLQSPNFPGGIPYFSANPFSFRLAPWRQLGMRKFREVGVLEIP